MADSFSQIFERNLQALMKSLSEIDRKDIERFLALRFLVQETVDEMNLYPRKAVFYERDPDGFTSKLCSHMLNEEGRGIIHTYLDAYDQDREKKADLLDKHGIKLSGMEEDSQKLLQLILGIKDNVQRMEMVAEAAKELGLSADAMGKLKVMLGKQEVIAELKGLAEAFSGPAKAYEDWQSLCIDRTIAELGRASNIRKRPGPEGTMGRN